VTYARTPDASRVVGDAATAAAIFAEHFDTPRQVQELLMGMYLDSRGRLLGVEALYRGTINGAMVGCRDVLRSALLLNAVSVLIAHLHPSGEPEPSAEDVTFTRRLVRAAEVVGVELHDHIVLGFGREGAMRFVSIRERGLM